ncbi:MAG: D-glucuronyl C5-epimerase family protein [Desulfitobacteriaceae bacterium]|nr:D-glucuronyl C5-epimerase family protein [Desulfitobacteriaceae bacterium]MDD4401031.1 D-glucuronyl C5-epimerase family protein [Desulfitobacteriaceae bacterium]
MKLVQMIKAYYGLVFDKTDYWHPEMQVNRNLALPEDSPGKYPVDISAKACYPGTFDEQDIPLVLLDGELRYVPVTIAQYALGNYDQYLTTGQAESKEKLIRCADWFVENLVEHCNGVWGWEHTYDNQLYNLKKPWLSALAQGQALSVLARAYREINKSSYLKTGIKALKAFYVPVAAGGLVARLAGGDFFEEYPSEIPSFVLNGFIFALWGLRDFYFVSSNSEAKERYQTGLKTLRNHLSGYNIGWLAWSRYDLFPFRVSNIASIFYHKLHIQQLLALGLLTDDGYFEKLAAAWQRSSKNPLVYLLATGYKIIHKLSVRRQSYYVPSIK